MDVQQNTRAVALVLFHALRELDASDGDILSGNATSLRIRGMRWTGVACAGPTQNRDALARCLLFSP